MDRSTRRRAAFLVRLGRLSYDAALDVQRATHSRRESGLDADVVFTVEHDPVFTCGRSARETSFRVEPAVVASAGIAVRDVERGGDVTYHGPGQLVVYPILDLRETGRDLHAHVWRLEEAVIRTLAAYGIDGQRRSGLPGVWTGRGKIASVGIAVRRWITFHGLALNVAVNREHFAMIHPCGLPVEAASICDFLPRPVSVRRVEDVFVSHYADVLGVAWHEADVASLSEVGHEV